MRRAPLTEVQLPALTARCVTDNDHEHARRLRDNRAARTWRIDEPAAECCRGLWVDAGLAREHLAGHRRGRP